MCKVYLTKRKTSFTIKVSSKLYISKEVSMLLKSNLSPEKRQQYFTWLGAAAQVALVLGILLQRFDSPGLDFFIGMLIGFSIVGNLASLYIISRSQKENRRQK
jgi:hypothetical protein